MFTFSISFARKEKPHFWPFRHFESPSLKIHFWRVEAERADSCGFAVSESKKKSETSRWIQKSDETEDAKVAAKQAKRAKTGMEMTVQWKRGAADQQARFEEKGSHVAKATTLSDGLIAV